MARKHCCRCHAAGQNRQLLPVYGVGTSDLGRPRLGRETQLLERDGHQVMIAPRLGLRLQLLNPRAAVSDWLFSSIGDLRRTGQPPAPRRTGRVSGFGPSSSGPQGSSLVSIQSGGMSPVFRLGQARRRKSHDMDCWVCAQILFWESNWRDYCPRSSFNRPGRNWASGNTTGPIICAINDDWTVANSALVISAVRKYGWEYLPTWTNGHSLGPSPGMAPEKTQESCREICYMSVG